MPDPDAVCCGTPAVLYKYLTQTFAGASVTVSREGEVELKRPSPALKTAAALAAAADLFLIWRMTVQSSEWLSSIIYLSVLEAGEVLYDVYCMEVSL